MAVFENDAQSSNKKSMETYDGSSQGGESVAKEDIAEQVNQMVQAQLSMTSYHEAWSHQNLCTVGNKNPF